jgi:hypothetical protein
MPQTINPVRSSFKKKYNTRNIVTIPSYPHLKELFDANEFEKFCNHYSKAFKLNKYLPFAVENYKSLSLGEGLKYIDFILAKQGHEFDTTYIEYLLENKLSAKVIEFFESIKNIKDTALCPEMISGQKFLKILNETQDSSLLAYVLNNPVKNISAFSNKTFIYGQIIENNLQNLLEVFHDCVDNVHLFAMDELFNTQDQSKVSASLDLLGIKDKDYLKSLINEYIADLPPPPNDYTFTVAVHQHDEISKAIWSKYCVTVNMKDKKTIPQKASKI